MGFLSSLSGAAGAVLGSSGGSAIAGALGLDSDPAKVDYEKQWKYTKKGINLGNQWDIANQKEMFDYRISQGLEAGMTPYEMYMGPAAGAGGGTTSSGQTLGNAGNQAALTNAQLKQQADQKDRDRYTALAQTAMQTSAQKDVANIQAGATTGAATITAETNERIAEVVNNLRERELEEVAIKRVANETGVAEAQVKKLLNEAKFTPEFKREITKMTMGVSNSVNLMLQKRFGVDVTSEKEMQKLSDKQMRNVLHVFMAADSNLYTEIAGLLGAASGEGEFNLDPIVPTLGNPHVGEIGSKSRFNSRKSYFGN